jgi:hypothetical protein
MNPTTAKVLFAYFILWGSLFSSAGFSKTRVGWMELNTQNGKPIQLEPGFYYAHMAIQVGNRWLHANPRSGVEIVSVEQLERVGKIKEILQSQEGQDEFTDQVPFFLNRPFDNEYSWSDEKIYCAELVAKLLGVAPSPMHFDDNFWPSWFQKYEGLPGSSPSKLYKELKGRGYISVLRPSFVN